MMLNIEKSPQKLTTGFVSLFIALVLFQISFALIYGTDHISKSSMKEFLITQESGALKWVRTDYTPVDIKLNLSASTSEQHERILTPGHCIEHNASIDNDMELANAKSVYGSNLSKLTGY